jgi:hypothetical protein
VNLEASFCVREYLAYGDGGQLVIPEALLAAEIYGWGDMAVSVPSKPNHIM